MKKLSLFIICTLLLVIPTMNGWAADFENIPKLTARGEASIFKPSDQMELGLGVVTSAETSAVALNDNNQRMRQIAANLQALGLDESDYQTGRFTIRPIYQKPAKNSQEPDYSKIVRYEVVNVIHVKTTKIDLIDKIIETAVQAGANQIDQVSFNLVNPQAYRTEAIQAAARNAFEDASALANSVGVKIKRVLSLTLDNWQQYPAPMMLKNHEFGNAQDSAGTVFEPGKAEIHTTVNVVYEIES